jgi:RHS repeat-associated protein
MVIDPALVAGESYTFLLSGFEDRAGNLMEGAIALAFEAPAEDQPLTVVSLAEPEILAVIDGPDGLALIAGAPVDPASVDASSLTVTRSGNEVVGTLALVDAAADPAWDGRVLLWTPNDPAAYLGARYDVALDLALLDVAGRPLDGPSTLDYDHIGQGDIVWSKPAEAPLLGGSQVGNDRFLHGRPYIRTLGLYDHRARFYEPGTQLFLEPDPLGPVDSPNLYQAFGFDGLNVTDPSGMETLKEIMAEGGLDLWDRGGVLNRARGGLMIFGYSVLNTVTIGFASRHDEYYEAYERGEIEGGEYVVQGIGVSGARSAVILTAAVATGGVAAGVGEGLALSTEATFALSGAATGGGAVLGSDVMDVIVLDERQSFSSPATYLTAMAIGGTGGYATGRVASVPTKANAKGVSGEQQVASRTGFPRNSGVGRERIEVTNLRTPTGRQAHTYPDFPPSETIPQRGVILDAKNVSEFNSQSGNIPKLQQAAAERGVVAEFAVRQPSAFSSGTRVNSNARQFIGDGPGSIRLTPMIDPLAGSRPPLTLFVPSHRDGTNVGLVPSH